MTPKPHRIMATLTQDPAMESGVIHKSLTLDPYVTLNQ